MNTRQITTHHQQGDLEMKKIILGLALLSGLTAQAAALELGSNALVPTACHPPEPCHQPQPYPGQPAPYPGQPPQYPGQPAPYPGQPNTGSYYDWGYGQNGALQQNRGN